MAGEYVIRGQLREDHVTLLERCGLKVQILVDCSHSPHVRTVRSDRPGHPLITKAIELDVTLDAPADPQAVYVKMQATLTTTPATSPTFEIYKLYQTLLAQPHGAMKLKGGGLKLEFPRFDNSIVNLTSPQPGTDIAKAIKACSAKTIADFNNLDADIRKSMGMYRRESVHRFVLNGTREPGPRTAV